MRRRIWAVPAALALVTVAGLVVALAGEGWHDAIGWAGLAAPVLAALRAIARRG